MKYYNSSIRSRFDSKTFMASKSQKTYIEDPFSTYVQWNIST